MRNAMWVGGGITGMGEIPMLGVREKGIAKVIRDIFRSGEQGLFYDPSDLKTQYQDATGTTTVNASGQPLGLLLDKSKGLVLGPELWDDSKIFFDGESSRISNNEYRILSTSGAYSGMSLSGTEDLRQYFVLVEFTVSQLTAGRVGIEDITQSTYGIGTHKIVARCGSLRFTFKRTGVTDAVIKDISVKVLKGNHAYQSTSAARPILKQTPILGNELVVNGDTSNGTDGWTTTNATLNTTDGSFVMTASSLYGGVTNTISLDTSKTYELTFTVTGNTTNASLTAITRPVGTTTNYATTTITTAGNYKQVFKPTANSSRFMFQHNNVAPTGSLSFTNVSIKEITGYRTDQNYIEYDGVDDKLLTNLVTPLTNATVLRAIPNMGTQVKYNQTLPMLYEDSTNHAGLIAIDRALTRNEQLRLMDELDKRAGAVGFDTTTFKMFDGTKQGFVFDPNDLSTMFQDAMGTNPVKAVGQPVGLVFDKSKGLKPTPVLSQQATFSFWPAGTTPPTTKSNDSYLGKPCVSVTFPQIASGDYTTSRVAGASHPVLSGKFYNWKYKVALSRKLVSGEAINVYVTGAFGSSTFVLDGSSQENVWISGQSSALVGSQGTNSFTIFSRVLNSPVTVYATDFSADTIDIGNYAYQNISAARPILRKNAVTGANYLEFDGSDDYLIVAKDNLRFLHDGTGATGFVGYKPSGAMVYHPILTTGNLGSSTLVGYSLSQDDRVGNGNLLNIVANGSGTLHVSNIYKTGISANPRVVSFKNKIGTHALRLNGAEVLNTSTEAGVPNKSASTNDLWIGRSQSGMVLQGNLYGVVCINRLTTDNETVAIEKELAKRVGVTLNV